MNSSYGQWGNFDVDVDPGMGVPVEELTTWQAVSKGINVAESLSSAFQDKYRAVLLAEQRLREARSQGQSMAYIQRLEVKYHAAVRAFEQQKASEASTGQYRLLGQVGAVTGIGIGAAAIFYILTRALR